jgi:IS605 OrfB family transposase
MLSKKVKLNLSCNQKLILETLSNEHRLLYNFLLEKVKDNLDFKQINQNYKIFRKENNLTINSKSAQNTSIGLINNIKSYLSLKKKDKSARFPNKFKSHKFFTSFMLDYNKGCGGFKIKDSKLELNLDNPKNKVIFNLPDHTNDISNGNVKTITFKREDDQYYLIFVYKEASKVKTLNKENFLGIDLGFSRLVTGCSKRENIKIGNLRQKKLDDKVSSLQGIRDKYNKGSRNYKKIDTKLKVKKRKLVNKQEDFQHKSSRNIVNYCLENNIGKLIVGDINVKSVINKDNYRINGLSKSTSSLGRFKTFLGYKSRNEGIEFILVNEAYTSRINSLTGKIEFDSSLKNREFFYEGMVIDRDVNSCINIIKKSGIWLSQDSTKDLLLNKISELEV